MKYLKMAVESKAREELLILREGSVITQIQEFSGKNNIQAYDMALTRWGGRDMTVHLGERWRQRKNNFSGEKGNEMFFFFWAMYLNMGFSADISIVP